MRRPGAPGEGGGACGGQWLTEKHLIAAFCARVSTLQDWCMNQNRAVGFGKVTSEIGSLSEAEQQHWEQLTD